MIRAAIFDLDGVVLDSMSIWRDLGARYLLHRGLTPEPGLGELLFAMSMEQGADYLRTHYPLPPEEDVLADLSAMLRDFYYNEVPEKDGARTALAFLRDRGVAVTAATSSPRSHVTRALERLGLLPYFRAIFTTGELVSASTGRISITWQPRACRPGSAWWRRTPSMPCKPPPRQATAPWAFSTPTARRISRPGNAAEVYLTSLAQPPPTGSG